MFVADNWKNSSYYIMLENVNFTLFAAIGHVRFTPELQFWSQNTTPPSVPAKLF